MVNIKLNALILVLECDKYLGKLYPPWYASSYLWMIWHYVGDISKCLPHKYLFVLLSSNCSPWMDTCIKGGLFFFLGRDITTTIPKWILHFLDHGNLGWLNSIHSRWPDCNYHHYCQHYDVGDDICLATRHFLT